MIVLYVVGRMNASTIFPFSDINLLFETRNFNVNLVLGVSLRGLAVAVWVGAVSSSLA